MLLRAVAPAGIEAPTLREMELWEIGVRLHGDIGLPGPRLIMPDGARTVEVD